MLYITLFQHSKSPHFYLCTSTSTIIIVIFFLFYLLLFQIFQERLSKKTIKNMEIAPQEERIHKDHQAQIMKGKRTKRQRIVLPSLTLAMASTSSSGGQSGYAMASPTTQSSMISTEEDHDMANCLMLLARGKTRISLEPKAVAATSNKVGLDVYQCKTCNKCFPSFQALGGHRTSHRKPKEIQKKDTSMSMSMMLEDYQDDGFNTTTNTPFSLDIVSKAIPISAVKAKVHECSICGAEFSSGQALGGHMRRHRSYTGTSVSTISMSNISEIPQAKKTRNVLQLDLNLPAPEDDSRGFSFSSKEQPIVFSPSPMIDCHY